MIAGYFAWTYYKSWDLLNDNHQMIKELNATSCSEPFYYFVKNAQTQLYMNNVQTIIQRNPFEIVSENINNMLNLDATFHEQHSLNIAIHKKYFNERWNNITIANPCSLVEELAKTSYPKLKDDATEAKCKSFGQLGQG